MKTKIARVLLPSLLLILSSSPAFPGVKRIAAVGDSWAALMTHPLAGNVLQTALVDRGFPDVEILASDETVVPGSSADQWAANHKGKLDRLRRALEANPEVDIAFVVIGGNDFLREARKRKLSMLTAEQRARLWFGIRTNIETLVTTILSCRPNLKVVLCDYDYLNLEALSKPPFNQKLMGISQSDLNHYLVELGRQKLRIAQNSNRVLYVNNWGLMQHFLAVPESEHGSAKFPRPGAPPHYTPFAGGDPTKPSPAAAFLQFQVNNGIHLNAEGYKRIIENALDQGLASMLATPGTLDYKQQPTPKLVRE